MTNLLVTDISSPISCIKNAEPAREGRLQPPCEPGSAMDHGVTVIAIDEFRVPVSGSRSVTVQLAMNEASQTVIAYVLAVGQPNGQHTADLIAKAARRVRRVKPDAVLALSENQGLAVRDVAKIFSAMTRITQIEYRAPAERMSRRFASTLAELMAKRLGTGLSDESNLELDMMVRAAVAVYHRRIVEQPLMRRHLEQAFARSAAGSRSSAGPAR